MQPLSLRAGFPFGGQRRRATHDSATEQGAKERLARIAKQEKKARKQSVKTASVEVVPSLG